MSSTLERMKAAVSVRRSGALQPVAGTGLALTHDPMDVRRGLVTRHHLYALVAIMGAIAFYFLVWASDRYATSVVVSVQSSGGRAPTLSAASLLGTLAPPSAPDAKLVQSYIGSRDLLNSLDAELDLRSHYSDWSWDFFSRMSGSATDEAFLAFYRKHVKSGVSSDTGNLSLEVEGFTPEFSLGLAQAIVGRAENFINTVGQEVAREEVAYIQQEVARARANLDAAQAELVRFQRDSGVIDGGANTLALQSVVNQLESDLVEAQATEKQLATFLNDGAPELEVARGRVSALQAQIAEERAKLRATDQQAINEVGLAFRDLELDLRLATDIYTASLTSLEQARVNSSRKLKHLVTVQSPALPDEALYPRRFYNTFSAWLMILVGYGIGMLIYATIREHRDV